MAAKPSPIMAALAAALSSGPAQNRGDAFHSPRKQDYFYPTKDGSWQSTSTSQVPTVTYSEPAISPTAIRLISWNIDILVDFGTERMQAALEHLNSLMESTPKNVAVVIFLQEMSVTDLKQIRDSKWINQRFSLTELDGRHWLSPYYGTTALVDRRLKIKNVFRVPFVSIFERDGLFIDVAISNSQSLGNGDKVLRLCNAHLESLIADPPVRPVQLKAASKYLHEVDVACALLAGDLNAIQPFDLTLYSENGLKDTFLELGGTDGTEEGYTWGQQVPQWMKEKFGSSRMDKILLTGDVLPKKFERIGLDVRVAEEHRAKMKEAGQDDWATDHYGVMGDFELTGGWNLQTTNSDSGSIKPKLS